MIEVIQNQFGITERKGIPMASSRKVAEIFNKRHDHVLRDIQSITDPKSGVSENFRLRNFAEITYKDSTGRKLPEYLLTRDGFTLLTMGFTGKKAMQFKEAYIGQFNAMEEFIKSLSAAKLEFPEFTQSIMAAHEEPKHYHFSNEINMINRIVLEMEAKQFKMANGIPTETQSIRPFLSYSQIKAIEKLQRFDTGLIITVDNFEERKRVLTEYYNKLQSVKLLA